VVILSSSKSSSPLRILVVNAMVLTLSYCYEAKFFRAFRSMASPLPSEPMLSILLSRSIYSRLTLRLGVSTVTDPFTN
jgi:hypothetical protein